MSLARRQVSQPQASNQISVNGINKNEGQSPCSLRPRVPVNRGLLPISLSPSRSNARPVAQPCQTTTPRCKHIISSVNEAQDWTCCENRGASRAPKDPENHVCHSRVYINAGSILSLCRSPKPRAAYCVRSISYSSSSLKFIEALPLPPSSGSCQNWPESPRSPAKGWPSGLNDASSPARPWLSMGSPR